MQVTLLLLVAAFMAEGAAKPAPKPASGSGKLAPAVAKEMTESIVAVNKALGLESWPRHGATPCVDRGGQGITAKSISADETRKCASTAIEKNFPELGKSYVLAIPMVSLGPMTVIALGHRRQRRLGRLLVRPGTEVHSGQAVRAVEMGQAHGRAEGEGVRRGHDALVPRRSEDLRRDARADGRHAAAARSDHAADGREVVGFS